MFPMTPRDLNAWSPVDGTVWGGGRRECSFVGGSVLLE